jgi:hypothetical protein
MPIKVETGVTMIETRGRPPSEEHMLLRTMLVGDSFLSTKRRETLYQIARAIGVKVKILAEADGVWRVWKRNNVRTRPIKPPKEDS